MPFSFASDSISPWFMALRGPTDRKSQEENKKRNETTNMRNSNNGANLIIFNI